MKAGEEVGMAIVKHRPTFEILPSEADGYLIVVTWPKGPEQHGRTGVCYFWTPVTRPLVGAASPRAAAESA